jgi:exoribonuclease R
MQQDLTECTLKFSADDRYYKKYNIKNSKTNEEIETGIDPIKNKLFDQDVFKINEKGEAAIYHSSLRSMQNIPAILVLEGDRIYGKTDKGRPLYRCIPDDRIIPEFLVPYTMKSSFNKKKYNKYVVFKFNNWNEKHPEGRLVNVLGCVTMLDNFYEYQLYCKSLYASIQDFTKKTMRELKLKSEDYFIDKMMNEYNVEDRRNFDIISIDPVGSKDFDDAFGLQKVNENTIKLSIYISNVSFWMNALDLWESFSQRISTIYLPDRKRPMLPTILSDALCSLQENRTRFAFTMDVLINTDNNNIEKINYVNTSIIVNRNLCYETNEMLTNPIYQQTLKLVKKLNNKKKYTDRIENGHDLVAYLMILMNYQTAKELVSLKTGIFRSVKTDKTYITPKNISDDVGKFLKTWNSFGGSYVKFENLDSHDILDFDAYIHITSPIRRLVDLLNIIQLQDVKNIFPHSPKSKNFYLKWTKKESFEYINTTMRSIRKVQNDSSLLKICTTNKTIMDKLHDGFIFDKIHRNDSLFQYMVYVPELKMVNRFTSRHSRPNNSKQTFKLFAFKDENRLKEKIRIELIE